MLVKYLIFTCFFKLKRLPKILLCKANRWSFEFAMFLIERINQFRIKVSSVFFIIWSSQDTVVLKLECTWQIMVFTQYSHWSVKSDLLGYTSSAVRIQSNQNTHVERETKCRWGHDFKSYLYIWISTPQLNDMVSKMYSKLATKPCNCYQQ